MAFCHNLQDALILFFDWKMSRSTKNALTRSGDYSDDFVVYLSVLTDSSSGPCVKTNALTLAGCSFNKYGLFFIVYGKSHQHTFWTGLPTFERTLI